MKNLRFCLALALVASLAGCGGSDDGSSDRRSAFAGDYAGTYESTDAANGDNGSLNITVASDGTITGAFTDSRYGSNGAVAANSRVQDDGTVVVNVGFTVAGEPGQSTTFQGTLARSSNSLTGTLDEQQGDFQVPFQFTLNRILN